MRRYFIKTYGCQMNCSDSEHLAGLLESQDYQNTRDIRESDVVLVNTCCVRKHAEDRAFGYIASLKGLKRKNPNLVIGVCGCIPAEPHIDIKKRFPHVDFVFGPNQPEKLREFLSSPPLLGKPRAIARGGGEAAWITIMHGCSNFCSYCVVPYVRGREYSRPIEEILDEINQVDLGKHSEIFLLGQNVNSYKYGLANLLRRISEDRKIRAGLKEGQNIRFRFLTSHPRDMSEDIIDAVEELDIVEEFFHLPIQSGDDGILKSMQRGYTVDYYRKLIDKIRAKMPKAEITTDVIVGFPGETEEQFENTLNLIKEIKFNAVNMAAYSNRPQTEAAKLPNQLSEEVKQARLQETIQVVREVVKCYNPQ